MVFNIDIKFLATPRWKMALAQLFGREIQSVSDGFLTIGYQWRSVLYIHKQIDIRLPSHPMHRRIAAIEANAAAIAIAQQRKPL